MYVDIDFTAAEKDLIRAIRSTRSFSFCTMSYPDKGFPQRGVIDAKRAVPLAQWLITKEKFQDAVATEYLDLAAGQCRLLIAPTGIGKSTKLPFIITQTHSHNGLVLCPDNLLASLLSTYVANKVVSGRVKAVLLRTRHMTKPEIGPTIYYASAAEFLFRYAAYPNMLTDLSLQYVYVDEAHENRPEYYFLRMLVASGYMASVRMFFGTATSGTFNMESSSGADRQVQTVPADLLNVGSIDEVTSNSPLYYKNINVRTLIFVAEPQEALRLQQYYIDHDIQAFVYTEETSTLMYSEVSKAISTCGAGALITTWVLQTGHTLDIDAVIDCGYTRYMEVTPNPMKLEIRKRFVTVAEQKQRSGRVGRHIHGKAYVANVKNSPVEAEIREGTHVYIYLWSVLYNLKIRTGEISLFERVLTSTITGKVLTREKAAVLLNSTLHPLTMHPFLDDMGKFYVGWVNIFRKTMNGAAARESQMSNADKVDKWTERNTVNDVYIDQIDKYKSLFSVPGEWEVIYHLAYRKFLGKLRDFNHLENRSVLSMVPPSVVAGPVRSKTVKSFFKPSVIRESVISNNFHNELSLQEEMTEQPDLDDGGIADDVTAWLGAISETTEQVVRTDFEELQQTAGVTEQFEKFQFNEVVPYKQSPKLRSGSFDSVFNVKIQDDVYSQTDLVLKHIFAKSASTSMRLYPMDSVIRKQFFVDEVAVAHDVKKVDKCITNKISIAKLQKEDLIEYFVSFVKVWNAKIILKMQQAAPVRGKSRGYTRAIVESADNIQSQLKELKSLLTICEQYRLYVGFDVRVVHGGHELQVLTPSYDREQQLAAISMAWGSDNAKDNIQMLKTLCLKHHFSKERFGVYFTFIGFSVGVAHVFCIENAIIKPLSLQVQTTIYDPDVDLVIWISNKMNRDGVLLRNPIDQEHVYVVGRNLQSAEIEVYGIFQVFGNNDTWVIDKTFENGCSGCAIVAVNDGMCLGFYTGVAPGTDGYYGTIIDYSKIEKYSTEIYN